MAYKFLNSAGCSLLTGQHWPLPEGTEPGSWIDAGAVRPCHQGVHACRPEDLPYWIDIDLWRIELEGQVTESDHKIVARRGRIVSRVETWSSVSPRFSEMAVWRTRDLAIKTLMAENETNLALQVQSVATVDEVLELRDAADELGDESPLGRSIGYAVDCAELAIEDGPASTAFVSAAAAGFAAMEASGDEASYHAAFSDERQYQAAWLSRGLQLN